MADDKEKEPSKELEKQSPILLVAKAIEKTKPPGK